jgi:hypothetical protein
MKFSAGLTNLGIEVSIGDGESQSPKPDPGANQAKPRKTYVYAHLDDAGKIFYIGKGEGRRAWSENRHFLWYRYVDKNLNGKYQVRILHDNLSPELAEEIEAAWIAHYSNDIVNWFNLARPIDYEALDRHNKLQATNRALIQKAKAQEKLNLALAAEMYVRAIDALAQYASINWESGIIGRLLDEHAQEYGLCGEIEALDRLTMCLAKLGRANEAANHVQRYFAMYRGDLERPATERIRKRVEKALARSRSGGPVAAQ